MPRFNRMVVNGAISDRNIFRHSVFVQVKCLQATNTKKYLLLKPHRLPFKLYHKTCEQFYRNFGIYEKSPNSFLPGLPHSIVNQFDFHNFLCLCLASVHLPHPFHLVSAFSFSVTPFCSASDRTISSMRFRAASSILAQYCLTYTQLYTGDFIVLKLLREACSACSGALDGA